MDSWKGRTSYHMPGAVGKHFVCVLFFLEECALDASPIAAHIPRMDRKTALDRLTAHTDELRALGLKSLALFGSTARGDAGRDSDVDLAAELDVAARIDLFRYAAISERLSEMLGTRVDLVSEPTRNARFQAEIDRDRLRVF